MNIIFKLNDIYIYPPHKMSAPRFVSTNDAVPPTKPSAAADSAQSPPPPPSEAASELERAAIGIQKRWRGKGVRRTLSRLVSFVDLEYLIQLSSYRLRRRGLLFGLCRRLLYFAIALAVVWMHQGSSVPRTRPPSLPRISPAPG